VAASTKVRESHLAAIETEDFDALGGDVYVRGFISAYARFVRLDPAPLLDAHRAYRHAQEPVPRSHWRRSSARPRSGPQVRVRSGRVAVLLVLVVVVIVGLVLAGLWDTGEAATLAGAGGA
jgi:cytoskeleton protein RodZ